MGRTSPMMEKHVTERILRSYFENKATHHEKQLIKEWLQVDDNEEIYYQYLAKWESDNLQFKPDQENALQSYKDFLAGKQNLNQSILPTQQRALKLQAYFNFKVYSVAASLILLVCASLYFYSDYFFYNVYSTSYGMTQSILLEDGSEVTLNANSVLKVPRDLVNAETRQVWLTGEAFFSVAKRPNKVKFIVSTNNLNVEVLGTKFNVNSRRNNTEVVLDEGSVKLTALNNNRTQSAVMRPGEYASLSETDTTFTKMLVKPASYSAWKMNRLVFEDTPLKVIAEKIEDYYGIEVRIDNEQLQSRQLTGTLPNNDLGVVLKSLSVSYNLEIVRKDDYIIFQ
jgi:transmembrane sensor